jgi:serine phosphatase RsbU (regulator of sigma subunit)
MDQTVLPEKKKRTGVPYSPGPRERIRIGLHRLLRTRSAVYQAIGKFARRFESELGRQALETGADLIRIELEPSEPVVRSVRFGREKMKIFLEEYETLWSFVQKIGLREILLDPRLDRKQIEDLFSFLFYYHRDLPGNPEGPDTTGSILALSSAEGVFLNRMRIRLRNSILTAASVFVPLPAEQMEKMPAGEIADRISADTRKARQFQKRILSVPETLPFRDRIVWSGQVIPSAQVGGDFFDIQPTDGGKLAFLFCDVSGSGLSAACTAAIVKTSFGACLDQKLSLRTIAEHLNADLCRLTGPEDFAAAFIGIYNPSTHILMYCSAGQSTPPWRISADPAEPVHPLADADNLLLGVDPKAEYKTARCRLRAGDKLMLVSDGILKIEDPNGNEYGMRSIEELLRQHRRESAAVLVNRILESVRQFSIGLQPNDDWSILTAEILL